MIFGFARRARVPELMDDPKCDPLLLERTFVHFKIINRMLTGRGHLARRHIVPLAKSCSGRPCRIVDLGCGAGDFALWLARLLERESVPFTIVGVDNDPRALQFARRTCALRADITFADADILHTDLASLNADIIHANHVLHHLDDERIAAFLSSVDSAARLGYLINDIARSRLSYVAYWAMSSLLFRGSFAPIDGLRSIRRGFTRDELRRHCRDAGIDTRARVRMVWPARAVVVRDATGR